MTTLSDKSRDNIKVIKNIYHDSILSSSSSRDVTIQEEFVEVDNIANLENGLYFTFHQCLSDMVHMDFLEKDILIKDIDECIQNIYDNKKLNLLMDGESELYKIINDIDIKLDILKESYYYDSPFYNYYSKYCLVKDYIFNIVKNPPCYGIVNFLKDYNHYFIKLNGEFCNGYSDDRVEYTESSEDESSSGSESESENKFD